MLGFLYVNPRQTEKLCTPKQLLRRISNFKEMQQMKHRLNTRLKRKRLLRHQNTSTKEETSYN